MNDNKRGGRAVETRGRVSDGEIDRAISSLVEGAASPELRANVVRRIAEPAGRQRPVVGRRLALAGAMLVVLAVSLWLTRGPGSPPPSTVPRVASSGRAVPAAGPGKGEAHGQVASVQPVPVAPRQGRAARRVGAPAVRPAARPHEETQRVASRTSPAETPGWATVDSLPDVPPLELTAIPAPQALVIAPVVVDPIEIPDLTIPPPAGDPGDIRRDPGSSEALRQTTEHVIR